MIAAEKISVVVQSRHTRIAGAAQWMGASHIGVIRVQAAPVQTIVSSVQIAAGFRADDHLVVPAGTDAEYFAESELTAGERQRKIIRRHARIDVKRRIAMTSIRAAIGIGGKARTGPQRTIGCDGEIPYIAGVRIAFSGDRRRVPELVRLIPPIKYRQRVLRGSLRVEDDRI